MSVAEATRSPRTTNAPKRKALGDGLYVRKDGRYEHGYTCRAPHDECSGRKWHVVTLKGTTKTTAKDEIAARVTALTRGESGAPTTRTVADVAAEWLASLDVKPRTLESYEYHLRVNILPLLGRRKVRDVRPQDIAEFVAALQKERKMSGWTAAG